MFGQVSLWSLAPSLYPNYLLIVLVSLVLFYLFSKIDFEVISAFSIFLYLGSLFLLITTLVIGRITRGTVRWIPLGGFSLQSSEVVRPFIYLFLANFLGGKNLTLKKMLRAVILMILPVFLILVQPSLGVSVITFIGFFGIVLASKVDKRLILILMFVFVSIIPILWRFLAPYQQARVETFLFPSNDPYGAGYNSIQSMITVGSGRFLGRGLGKGIQTQLLFLPEKHTDFIFASISEEFGFLGSSILLTGIFMFLYVLIRVMEHARNPVARAYVAGIFLSLFAQIFIHIGMNMGILPITGLTLPLISAGGSSLIATMIGLGMVISAKKV